jgi:hypothetical protein
MEQLFNKLLDAAKTNKKGFARLKTAVVNMVIGISNSTIVALITKIS